MTKSREAFRTISEVSEWLDTPAHVLRFWESKFPQIKPVKRAGGRRYYRPDDMALLGGIKTLLHEHGITIKGVQKVLREKGVRHVASLGPSPLDVTEGEWLDLGPEEAPDSGVVATEVASEAQAPMPAVVEVVRPPRPASVAPGSAPETPPRRPPAPRPAMLAAIIAADPARITARRARIFPLVARLTDLRSRMVLAR